VTTDRVAQGQRRPCEPRPIEGDVAIESCRTSGPRRHVARCEDCAHEVIAYNSCRNRHCPKCQGRARPRGRAAAHPILPCGLHLAGAIGDIAFQNKAVIYDLLFKASAETMITIAADPKHWRTDRVTSVLHTWGRRSPTIPCPYDRSGGGISLDVRAGQPVGQASSCRCACFRGCSRLFLEKLVAVHAAGACNSWRAGQTRGPAPPSRNIWRRHARSNGGL